MTNDLDRQALSFARLCYRGTMHRTLVFQRPPGEGETRIDAAGRPSQGSAAHIDIDPTHPIPCNFTIGQRRDLVVQGQQRTVTTFKITIPGLYWNGSNYSPVDFSTDYQAHVLAKDSANKERFFQVVGSGDDLGPDITFEAVELKELI